MNQRIISMLLIALASLSDPANGQTMATVDFARDVYPILRRSCLECHGPNKHSGDLRLDVRDSVFDNRELVVPGRPDKSELIRRIELPAGHDEIMPATGQPLTPAQQSVLRRWVVDGADWPVGFQPGLHWSYVAPIRPNLPAIGRSDWVQTPIDAFVLARLEREGLQPSSPAPAEKLVRRLFLDLIGLPPSVEELDQYAHAGQSPERLERLVDDLLSRPQFGERWARPWLDAARYADSHGFQRDNLRDMWAYRDWVIAAFNADMPFDQFTIEQLAGDLLPDATTAQRIATGFHRTTPVNVEAGSLPEETRIEQVIDRVNTTAAVWLGTTMECCQCHDHKYDPFTQREYYRLLAYFNNTEVEAERTNPKTPSSIDFKSVSIPLPDSVRDAERQAIETQLNALQQDIDQRRQKLLESLPQWADKSRQTMAAGSQAKLLEPIHFESQGTTDTYKILPDGSLLVEGDDPPDKDVYTLRFRAGLRDVRAFRLEALRHESLPGGGPGRGDAARRNFVLHDFSVEVEGLGPLKFARARASFSQKNYDVLGAVDDDPKTGWAISPEFDQSHWAVFELAQPIEGDDVRTLTVRLSQQLGSARTIGCLRLSALSGELSMDALPQQVVAALRKPAAEWTQSDRDVLLDHRQAEDAITKKLVSRLTKLNARMKQLAPATTEVMRELPAPRMTTIFERGDYRKAGQPVSAGTPSVLHAAIEGPDNRLTLAQWLVARENPLVARVTVNRWWAELFGHGLVTTPEDFGAKGEPPSHPELLDWLACEFMDNGWSLKHLLKTIVLSRTYQQDSKTTAMHLQRDPHNALLSRGPTLRMDAEMVRDNALAIGGLLSKRQFGPPIRPFQPDGIWKKVGGTAYTYELSPVEDRYRRGIYVILKRGTPYPSFINFDANPRLNCTLQRPRTNTPLQALTLLNDPVFVEAAEALASRVQNDLPDATTEKRIDYMFRLCTARHPNEAERETLIRLYRDAIHSHSSPGGNDQDSHDAKVSDAAWRSLAAVALNLHETITKD